jgi:hypothetical protein
MILNTFPSSIISHSACLKNDVHTLLSSGGSSSNGAVDRIEVDRAQLDHFCLGIILLDAKVQQMYMNMLLHMPREESIQLGAAIAASTNLTASDENVSIPAAPPTITKPKPPSNQNLPAVKALKNSFTKVKSASKESRDTDSQAPNVSGKKRRHHSVSDNERTVSPKRSKKRRSNGHPRAPHEFEVVREPDKQSTPTLQDSWPLFWVKLFNQRGSK